MPDKLDEILILPSQMDYKNKLEKLCEVKAPAGRFAGYDSKESNTVINIVHEVVEKGDKAVAKYTNKFDSVDLQPEEFKITPEELQKAHSEVDQTLLKSIRQAITNVRKYQEEIFIGHSRDCSDGTGIRYTPIKRIGVCVPGAAAPLPSTVVMTVVPAQVAKVKEIAVVSPPRHNRSIHPVTLAVCCELGVTEVYRIGGVQAVAALASGTETIKKVDKIVGPGNRWVQTAKKDVSWDYVDIDSIMGPSEVLIIARDRANPAWVAADMLSQAEHGEDSSAIVLTDSEAFAKQVLEELKSQIGQLSRASDAEKSLLELGKIIVVNNMAELIGIANDLASEHLQIQCGQESREIAGKIENAGAIFIGDYSPVAVGDYWAGPSHTLPTEKRARFSSALSANDFVKSTSIIEYSKERLAQSSGDIIRLAQIEGLDAHAKSVEIRQEK